MKNRLTRLAAALALASLVSGAMAQGLRAPTYFALTTPSLSHGVPAAGSLTEEDGQNFKDGSRVDVYTFMGAADEEVHLLLESDDFDTYLSVFDPSGFILDMNDDDWTGAGTASWSSSLNLYLSEEGRYTVVVSGYSAWDLGDYTLELSSIARPSMESRDLSGADSIAVPSSQVLNLSADLPATGSGYSGPSRVYSFSLQEDLLVIADASSETVDTVLILHAADGTLLHSNDDYFYETADTYVWRSRITAELPAGDYYLVVGSFSEFSDGDVELVLNTYRPVR